MKIRAWFTSPMLGPQGEYFWDYPDGTFDSLEECEDFYADDPFFLYCERGDDDESG